MNKNLIHTDLGNTKVSEKEAVEFVLNRFSQLKKSKTIRDLSNFQAMNKYMLMSHSPQELKILGNVVASNKKIPLSDLFDEYGVHLRLALRTIPTTKKHFNVLMHIFGYFSKYFSKSEKDLFMELLLEFEEEKISLGKILSELHPLIYRFNNTYLANQTYFLLYADTRPGILFDVLNRTS